MKNIRFIILFLIVIVLVFLFLPGLLKSFEVKYFSASLSRENTEKSRQIILIPEEAPEVLKGKWKLLK